MNTTKTTRLTMAQIRAQSTGVFFNNCNAKRRTGDSVNFLPSTYTGKTCSYFLTHETNHYTHHTESVYHVWEFRHSDGSIHIAPWLAEPTNKFTDRTAARQYADGLAIRNSSDGLTADQRRRNPYFPHLTHSNGEII